MPIMLLPCPFSVLPKGKRRKLPVFRWTSLGLPPIEGFFPAAPEHLYLPTGRDAVPQLFYHLTLHPMMLAVALAGYAIHAPVAILYFALWGHRVLLRRMVQRWRHKKRADEVGAANVGVGSKSSSKFASECDACGGLPLSRLSPAVQGHGCRALLASLVLGPHLSLTRHPHTRSPVPCEQASAPASPRHSAPSAAPPARASAKWTASMAAAASCP